MRNLKKFLALVLAMVMALSLMVTANAANVDFKDDQTITEEFKDAVLVLGGLKVFQGDNNSNFNPKRPITRAEVAAIIYRLDTADVEDNQAAVFAGYGDFGDVSSKDWFAPYAGYCANAGYIKGVGKGADGKDRFNPYGNVTGYEALAMILRAVGYDAENEFTGSQWRLNVASRSRALGVLSEIDKTNMGDKLTGQATREVVASLLFETARKVPQVTWSPALHYSDSPSLTTDDITNIGSKWNKNLTLGYEMFKLIENPMENAHDEWGRPSRQWMRDLNGDGNRFDPTTGDTAVATIKYTPVYEGHVKVLECDIAYESKIDANMKITSAYIDGEIVPNDGVTLDGKATIEALDRTNYMGGNGRILEVYKMDKDLKNGESGYRVVEINTYLALVDKVSKDGKDTHDHPYPATIDLTVYSGIGNHNRVHSGTIHTGSNAADYAWSDLNWHSTSHNLYSNDNQTAHIAGTWNFDGIVVKNADDYSVGQPVLVWVNQAKDAASTASTRKANVIESYISKADIKSGGFVMSWTDCVGTTPDKTIVGTTTFEDADKFCMGWRDLNTPYQVVTDKWGNAIGLMNQGQYLVIEKIEWQHTAEIGGGYASMNAITSGGEEIRGAKVVSINNLAPVNSGDSFGKVNGITTPGATTAAYVSDYYTNNNNYYSHIFSYTKDADGNYSLLHNCDDFASGGGSSNNAATQNAVAGNLNGWAHKGGAAPNAYDLNNATIAQGEATISGTTGTADNAYVNSVVVTDNTLFAVMNVDGYTYTTFKGKNNVPSITGAKLCIVGGGVGSSATGSGYATMVVVRNTNRVVVASEKFGAYVSDINPVDGKYINGTYHYGYDVKQLGGGTVRLYRPTQFAETGFYNIVTDGNSTVLGATAMITGFDDDLLVNGDNIKAPATAANVVDVLENASVDRVRIGNVVSGFSIKTTKYSALMSSALSNTAKYGYTVATNGDGRDYSLTSNTKVYKLSMNAYPQLPAAAAKPYIGNTASSSAATDRVTVTPMSVNDLNVDTIGTIAWVYYTQRSVQGMTVYEASEIYVLELNNGMKSVTSDIKLSYVGGATRQLTATIESNLTLAGDTTVTVEYRVPGTTTWTVYGVPMTYNGGLSTPTKGVYQQTLLTGGVNQISSGFTYEVRVHVKSTTNGIDAYSADGFFINT